MSKKRRQRQRGPRKPARRQPIASGPRLVTPEGDPLVLASVDYAHDAPEEIRRILSQAPDFGLDDDIQASPDGSIGFPWYEMDPGASPLAEPLDRRILATLTLTPTTLRVETLSRRRRRRVRRRLQGLLGDHIQLIGMESQTVVQVLEEPALEPAPEPLVLPPEAIAELEERMIRQWLDESIPALGGQTPREAVKTAEGRQRLLALFDYIDRQQERASNLPGMFSPDYRKAKKMLGLE
jgi:hypothetical protein